MKKIFIIGFLACAFFSALKSCESKSNYAQSSNYNSSAKTTRMEAIYNEIDRSAKAMNDQMGYPQPSEDMQDLQYRCNTLHDPAACVEWQRNLNQSMRGMNQNIEETERERQNQ